MTELILGTIVVSVLALLAYEKWEHKRTIDKLTNALVARSAKEMRDLDVADKVVVPPTPQVSSELTSLGDLDDKEFIEEVIERDIN